MSKVILMKGIDVSKWQGDIDFYKVKKSGIDFVIIKAGGSDCGYYKDSYFESNYHKAMMAGLKVGCYFFCGANFTNENTAKAVANYFSSIIRDKAFTMPIVLDIEATSPNDKEKTTQCTIKCAKMLEDFGYFVTIYGSEISGFKDRMVSEKLKMFDFWVAKYSNKQPTLNCGMWQYSSTGSISGVKGNVDLDYSFRTYAEITQYKLNKIKDNDLLVAFDVIKGLYGNGSERKEKLEKLGYNYNKIQEMVNRIIRWWG